MWFSAVSGVARILGFHLLPFVIGWTLYALEEGAIQGDVSPRYKTLDTIVEVYGIGDLM
jgi:hypothetical protein